MTNLMIKGFTEGCWYKWVGAMRRPTYFNTYGGMDFILSGCPVQCKFVVDRYEAVLGEPVMNSLWGWEEAIIDGSLVEITDPREIQPCMPIIIDPNKARPYLQLKVRASMFYRYLQSLSYDVTEGSFIEICAVDLAAPFVVETGNGGNGVKCCYQFIQPIYSPKK